MVLACVKMIQFERKIEIEREKEREGERERERDRKRQKETDYYRITLFLCCLCLERNSSVMDQMDGSWVKSLAETRKSENIFSCVQLVAWEPMRSTYNYIHRLFNFPCANK